MMKMISRSVIQFSFCCAILFGLVFQTSADVKLPAIFSDHMVLQAGVSVPVWGWADPGEEVTVSIGRQSKTTTAGKDGKWSVKLGKLKSGEPMSLIVQGRNKIVIQDVLIGEVWLCSGQSNMAMTVDRCDNFEQEKAAARLPLIRMFSVERSATEKPQSDCKGKWVVCSPQTVGSFSATAYFFGRDVFGKMKTPVGLINSSWGGTTIEAWTSMEAQSRLTEYPIIAESWDASVKSWDEAKANASYEKQLAAWKSKKSKGAAPRKPVHPRLNHNHPANLFNGMIAPLVPYAIRGGIWYQGEANAGKIYANLYGLQLATMIKDWRARWGYEFPFAWVQLPDFDSGTRAAGWVTVREQMLKTLSVPKTGMAVALGLGEAKDIHPKNKQGVGNRLAMWALADVYKQKGVTPSGPVPAKHEIKDGKVIVKFKHTGQGLVTKPSPVKGFTIAGADQKWFPAEALIDGNTVIISSQQVTKPVAVRYAWSDNPEFSLYNKDGLPMTPFRTDDWK